MDSGANRESVPGSCDEADNAAPQVSAQAKTRAAAASTFMGAKEGRREKEDITSVTSPLL
jgi:hypothetical protein